MSTNNNRKYVSGLTLIEVLISVAIFVVMIGAISLFINNLQTSRLRAQMMLEVDGDGARAVRLITRAIRGAVSINVPMAGDSGSSLSLSTGVASTTPTVFSVVDGILFVNEGVNKPIALTSGRTNLSGLTFSNLSGSSTPGIITVRFTLGNGTSSVQAAAQYAVDFYGSAAIR